MPTPNQPLIRFLPAANRLKWLGWIILLLMATAPLSADSSHSDIQVLTLTKKGMSDWDAKVFQNKTEYTLTETEGKPAVKAVSQGNASAMYREIKIDIKKTPYLNWSWKVDKLPGNKDEKTKAGDDFAARIYIVVKDGFFPWQAKSINYVWSTHQQIGASWPNPFVSSVIMKAVNSGRQHLGEWQSHKVNVYEDLKQTFGKTFDHIDGVALMTDTDNSGTSAEAWYGAITFTSD